MDVQQLPISKFLKTANSLIIPVYQRDYAWKIQHCEKLWMDVKKLISNENESHFLGTIVTINDGYGKYLVIDGQQRLTTISIFLIALIHYLKEKKIKSDDENQLQRVLKSYIIDEESISSDTKIKLKPNKSDLEFFEDLFDGNQVIENESNITNNYFYFKKEFKKEELTPFVIFEKGLKRLKIVSIDLNRGQDDPQLIFESLNSTGVDLTAGDLIRNYILMDLEPDKQEKLYKQYWVKIENLSGDIAEFIRNYLIFKQKKWIKKNRCLFYF